MDKSKLHVPGACIGALKNGFFIMNIQFCLLFFMACVTHDNPLYSQLIIVIHT